MRLLVHKTNHSQLALLLDMQEWITNAYRAREWVSGLGDPSFRMIMELEGIIEINATPFDGYQVVVLQFLSEDKLKEWVQDRIIQVLTPEEYQAACKEYGTSPEGSIQVGGFSL